MKLKLAQVESRLQAIIEGGAAFLFSSNRKPVDIAAQLEETMQRGCSLGPGDIRIAPNLYTVRIHVGQAAIFQENPALLDELTQRLSEAAENAGIIFSGPLAIRLDETEEIKKGEFQIQAGDSRVGLPETSDIVVHLNEEPDSIPANAFLIVDGTRIFNLTQPVINIGRRPDNQLVIEDGRVSRLHAQLRAVRGQFIIFDVGSNSGTLVNGEPIHQHPLQPGDVISLSGVPLVYGQDQASEGPS